MTQPGAVTPPRPGWWVRTDRVGTTAGTYGWLLGQKRYGHTAGSYGWNVAPYGTHELTTFPYTIPFEVDGEVITAADLNAWAAAVNTLGAAATIIADTPLVSAAATLTLDTAHNVYVHSGSGGTWTLPAVTASRGAAFLLFNRGSGTVTVTCAGGDRIVANAVLLANSGLPNGATSELVNDGTYWLTLT